MSELSRSLVDAAAEAIGDSGYASQAVVVAVLETLARSGQVAWAESLQGLANEVREGR